MVVPLMVAPVPNSALMSDDDSGLAASTGRTNAPATAPATTMPTPRMPTLPFRRTLSRPLVACPVFDGTTERRDLRPRGTPQPAGGGGDLITTRTGTAQPGGMANPSHGA